MRHDCQMKMKRVDKGRCWGAANHAFFRNSTFNFSIDTTNENMP